MSYRNFDMQILRAGEEYLAQTEAPDAGNASLNFKLPFSEDVLEALLSKLGPARQVRSMEKPIEAAKRFGGQLYKAVFSSGIGSALDLSIAAAKKGNERLRIRLRLTKVPELANLPWEYLYDELNDRFLALSYKTSIVRYLDVPQSINPLAVKPPLRALVMASSPIGYDALGVDKEWNNLQAALGKIPRGLVEVDRTEKATLMALQERLSGGKQYHIFHYIGHGGFDPRTGKSVLVMEDDHRQARFVDGPQLGVLLHNHPSLRIAILNACEGAVANQNDVFTGVAQNLIRQEMPAVIAMQFEITDSVAVTLAKAFYESLARSAPVDTALAEARLAVYAAHDGIEWGTPVLYLRADDGRLFLVEPPPPPGKQTTEQTTEETTETTEYEEPKNLPPYEPAGNLSPSSRFYIEREADKKAMEMITQPGITLSIKASGQTGASSLLRRLMEAARQAGKRVAHINFQQAFNDTDLTDSDVFHKRFCLALTHELDLDDRVTQYWEKYDQLSIGDRCTRYLRYLLQSLGPQPLTIAMDEVDRLIDAGFRSSFFGMLRSWHNERATQALFEKLDIVLVTSLEPHQLIDDPTQSPYNVSEVVSLNDFTPEEAVRLNHVYGAPLTARQIEQLVALIGGHPYLLQRAFHQIAKSNLTIDQVCSQSTQESGLFGQHLSSWFAFLQRNPFLQENLKKVLSRSEPDWNAFLILRKLGLVRREGARTQFRCKLYEDYFREQFHSRRGP